jgi:arylsulfatase A-like enzyme
MKIPLPLTATLSSFAVAGTLFAAEQTKPPNLIVIMTDDLGYADVGFNGRSDIPTPNIDRIASAGVVFTDAYVTFPVCGPSRAAFITGRYPQRFGFERNPKWDPADPSIGVPLEEKTIAEALRPAGYTSGLIGKWHLGAHETQHPLARGFEEFYGHLGGGHRYFPGDLTIKDYRRAKDEGESYLTWIMRNREPVRTEEYLTDEFSREAVEFVQRHQDHPFFLFLAYNAPHTPMQAPEEDVARFAHLPEGKRRVYAAMVSAVDRGVGRLLDQLDKLGLAGNTLVFFLSDNGGATNDNAARNAPLRGQKSNPFEGGIRVPMAARWPGVIPAGTKFTEPVSALDIMATIAAANGLPENAERPLDGVDLVPYLRDGKAGPPHKRIYLRMHDRGVFALREGAHKIVKPARDGDLLLFDLAADIGERENRSGAEATRVGDMLRQYETWNAELKPPAFPGLKWRPPKPGKDPP